MWSPRGQSSGNEEGEGIGAQEATRGEPSPLQLNCRLKPTFEDPYLPCHLDYKKLKWGDLASSEDVNEMGRNSNTKKKVLYSPARANLGSTPQQVLRGW